MSARAAILARIAEALKQPARVRSQPRTGGAPAPDAGGREFADCLPRVGPSYADRLAAFRKAAEELRTVFEVLDGPERLADRLRHLAREAGWKRVAAHRGPITDPALAALGLDTLLTDGGYDREALEACDVGITGCDLLVAQTGSVVVNSRSHGGRALSVLPPHHVVLARCGQLVGDLPEAFAAIQRLYGGDYPSMISWITGPSRTGDIERILVLGAHGPKQLTVLMIQEHSSESPS